MSANEFLQPSSGQAVEEAANNNRERNPNKEQDYFVHGSALSSRRSRTRIQGMTSSGLFKKDVNLRQVVANLNSAFCISNYENGSWASRIAAGVGINDPQSAVDTKAAMLNFLKTEIETATALIAAANATAIDENRQRRCEQARKAFDMASRMINGIL